MKYLGPRYCVDCGIEVAPRPRADGKGNSYSRRCPGCKLQTWRSIDLRRVKTVREPLKGRFHGMATTACPRCAEPRTWRLLKRSQPVTEWARHCKKCHQQVRAEVYQRYRIKNNARVAQRRIDEPVFRATMMWKNAQHRARKAGLEFSVDLSRIINGVLAGRCESTGLLFDLQSRLRAGFNPFSPSIDRIDSSRGYTAENVKVVCWIYNRAKAAGSHADVVKLANALCVMEEEKL